MKNHDVRFLVFLVTVLLFGGFVFPGSVFGLQDEAENSSRRTVLAEATAIEAVEKAGGKVYRISAADTTREVSFSLAGAPVGDEAMESLPAIGDVIWLNLAGSKVTATGLQNIEGMKLEKLHLERSTVDDAAMKVIKSQPELEYLNLYGTAVTDKGLAELSEMKKLKKLYVWQTKVTKDGIKQLQEKLPELEIVGECKLIPVVKATPEKKGGKKKSGGKKAGDKPAAEKKPADKPTTKKDASKK